MIIQHATRADWLRDRLNGIGGSDAGKILGCSEYGSPFSAWADRVFPSEKIPHEPVPGTPMDFGLRHERANAEAICAMLGATLIDLRAPGSFCASVVLDGFPFLRSTPDFMLRDRDGRLAVFQGKCVDVSKSAEWRENNAPEEFEVQIQHEMLTCQSMDERPSYGVLGAVIGGNRPVIRIRQFDEQFAEEWAAEASRFWSLVEKKIPPRVDTSTATRRAAMKLHARERREAETMKFSAPDWVALAEERFRLDALEKATKARLNEIDSQFALAMKTAKRGEVDGVGKIVLVDVEETMMPPTFVPTPRDGYSFCRWYPAKNGTPRKKK